jgi:hypothetical protein
MFTIENSIQHWSKQSVTNVQLNYKNHNIFKINSNIHMQLVLNVNKSQTELELVLFAKLLELHGLEYIREFEVINFLHCYIEYADHK